MPETLYNFIIIRYGEIGLKSKKVRRRLEDLLLNRIIQMLQRKNISYDRIKLHPTRGRLFLYTSQITESTTELLRCFGITSVSPAFKVPSERHAICEGALKLAENLCDRNQSFAIRTKRVGQHPFTSQQISAEVGTYVLEQLRNKALYVNLTNPTYTIYIEIRDKETYIFDKRLSGVAGLPYGSQGKTISLFSGGIDSPVAAWLMMKRGCDIIPLFCDLSPFSTIAAFKRAIKGLQNLFQYSPYSQITLYCTPHGEILKKIKERIPAKLTCLFCKRTMYKVAEKLAQHLNAKAIITGENLGQVASQTLDNLMILNQATSLPVFRPLIAFEKNDTINLSRKLGLYESSIMPVPSCGAVPSYPETHGKLASILEIEKEINLEALAQEEFQALKTVQIKIPPNKESF
ncbi:MAG: tRNA uracil 4-sulfurtransferase ThiI [Candidatus Helarchaeota archaeon]